MKMTDGWREWSLNSRMRRKKSEPALQPLLCFGLRHWQLVLPLAGRACSTSDLGRLLFLHLCFNLDRLLKKQEALKCCWCSGGRRAVLRWADLRWRLEDERRGRSRAAEQSRQRRC